MRRTRSEARDRVLRLAVFALAGAALAAVRSSAASPLGAELESRIERMAAKIPGHRVGICVRELHAGRVLYQRQSAGLYELASNTKLLTTAAALDTLGGEYGFVTRLYASGSVDYFGNLDGDIVISGSGDPSLTGQLRSGSLDAVVGQWASAIQEHGIRSIMGNIVVDTTLTTDADNRRGGDFEDDGTGDEGDGEEGEGDEAEEQLVPTEALILLVTAGPTPGKRASLSVRPAGTSLKVLNSCFTVNGPTREVKVTRGRNGVIVVGGKIGKAAGTVTHILAYGDPGLQAAALLRERLPRQGVPVLGDVTIARLPPPGPEVTMVTESRADLVATLAIVNKLSHNQTAEEILRVMGSRAATGESGVEAAGCRAVGDFLERQGITPAAFNVADGSGLSHANRMTPEAMTQLLVAMAASPHAETYRASLAVPGEDGTLRARLSGAERYGRIVAKTGHISGVNTLSGYLDTQKGAYAFSLLTNGKSRLDNGFLDGITTQLASALAVADGSIGPGDGAPAPSWSTPKATGKRKHPAKRRSSSTKKSTGSKSKRK